MLAMARSMVDSQSRPSARHSERVARRLHPRNAGAVSHPLGKSTFSLDRVRENGVVCARDTARGGTLCQSDITRHTQTGELARDSPYTEGRTGDVRTGRHGEPKKAADPTTTEASYPRSAPRCRALAVVPRQRAGSRSCETPRVLVQDTRPAERLWKTRTSSQLKPLPFEGEQRPGSGSAFALRSANVQVGSLTLVCGEGRGRRVPGEGDTSE